MTNEETLAQLHQYATQILGGDGSGHGMDHIDRVVANARRILRDVAEPIDELLVLAACTLHDSYDDKLVSDVAAGRAATGTALLNAGFDDTQAERVLTIIDRMSFHYSLDHPEVKLSLEGQIVQDADRLDAIGAIGIARAFAYGGHKSRPLYSNEGPRTELTGANYRQGGDTINHFYEKLLGLSATLNTAAARGVGEARTAYMRAFLAEFGAEVHGEA
jgi:uncharacterized protein